MIVKWNKKRLLIIPVLGDSKSRKKWQALPIISKIKLLPGYNEIDNDTWQAIEPSLVEHIKNGYLEKIEKEIEQSDGKIQKKAVSLKDVEPEKCYKILEETNNYNVLKKWLNNEKRDDVRLAIKQRIDEVDDYIAMKKPERKRAEN